MKNLISKTVRKFFEKKSIFDISIQKVILITGASSGLGLAIAKKLLKIENTFLILTSRETSLFKFAETRITETSNLWIRSLEVSDHSQISILIDEINDKLGGVDILINNAGVADRSTVEESCHNYRQHLLDINYLAPLEIISQVLSLMRKKKSGRIINISSAGGFMAMPTMSSYSASKFALEGATESLWYEVKPWGIHVTLVIPGFINSLGFSRTLEGFRCKKSLEDRLGNYHEHYSGMKKMIARRMARSTESNENIASKVVEILKSSNPPLRVYVTFDAWLFYMARKLCPAHLYMMIVYNLLPNISKWGKQPYRI